MREPLALKDSDLEKEILNSELPILVDFWASWCPPCKMIEPTMKELAKDLEGAVRIAKINVDQNPQSASLYDITGVPTFIVFKNGKEIERSIGAQSKKQLMNMLEKGIKKF